MSATSIGIPSTAIDAACRTWGFFQVVNHGIDAGLIDAFEAQMVHFFKLPADVKRAVKRTATNSRGFADDELTKQLRDLKELYDVGHCPRRDLAADAPENVVMDGYNQWPDAAAAPDDEGDLPLHALCRNARVPAGAAHRLAVVTTAIG